MKICADCRTVPEALSTGGGSVHGKRWQAPVVPVWGWGLRGMRWALQISPVGKTLNPEIVQAGTTVVAPEASGRASGPLCESAKRQESNVFPADQPLGAAPPRTHQEEPRCCSAEWPPRSTGLGVGAATGPQ